MTILKMPEVLQTSSCSTAPPPATFLLFYIFKRPIFASATMSVRVFKNIMMVFSFFLLGHKYKRRKFREGKIMNKGKFTPAWRHKKLFGRDSARWQALQEEAEQQEKLKCSKGEEDDFCVQINVTILLMLLLLLYSDFFFLLYLCQNIVP